VDLYCAGLSMNAIGKRRGISAQGVMRWIRDHARDHCPKPEPEGRQAVVVEIGEMWRFVEKRRASSGSGRPSSGPRAGLIDWECGDRDAPTLDRLPGRVEPWGVRLFCTDDWPAYDAALPAGRHYVGKDQTQCSESNNARQRHRFARFRRRTCVISRSTAMVDATMLFAFYHYNGGSLTPALVG
jgi:insertion element IS1 protein InsB